MVSSLEIIRALRKDGWKKDRVKGDHYQFTHPTKKGIVTVPHPTKDVKIVIVKSIEKQSGLNLRKR